MKIFSKIFILISLVFMSSAVAEAAIATFTLDELVVGADSIAIGKVKKIRYQESRASVFTYVTVVVEKYLKNALGEKELSIYYPGGTYENGIEEFVEDTPLFKEGERVLIFIKEFSLINVYAWAQGKFTIENDQVLDPEGKFLTGEERVLLTEAVSIIKEYLKKEFGTDAKKQE